MTCPLGLLRLHHPTWRRGGGGTDQNPGTFVENWGENSQEWPKKMKCWFLVLLIFCFWSKHWASKFNHSFCYIDFTWFHWQVCIVMMILQRGLDVFNILVETGYTRSIWQCFFGMINHGILVNQWLYLVVKLLVRNPGIGFSQDCYILSTIGLIFAHILGLPLQGFVL